MQDIKELTSKDWFPYVVPFFVFMVFTVIAGYMPSDAHIIYALKTIVVGLMLLYYRGRFPEVFISKKPADWVWGIFWGIIVLLIWVVPAKYFYTVEGGGFDPYSFGVKGFGAGLVIFFRIFGSSVVVPVLEELFWRSFLLRYLINSDFLKEPVGKFSWFSFIGVAVCFGLEHREIVAGIIAGIIYNGLVVWRKNLFVPILAHAVTNFGLALYVLATESYNFW